MTLTSRSTRRGLPTEGLRDLYTLWGAPDLAGQWLDALITGSRAGTGPEVCPMMARTLVQRREAILPWHTTGHSNGPVEGFKAIPSDSPTRPAFVHQVDPATTSVRSIR